MTGADEGGELPDFAEICSVLVKDPFCLSMEAIGRLTTYQIYHVYLRPPKEEVSPSGYVGEGMTYRDIFVRHWQRQGLTPEQIEERWVAEGHDKEEGEGDAVHGDADI